MSQNRPDNDTDTMTGGTGFGGTTGTTGGAGAYGGAGTGATDAGTTRDTGGGGLATTGGTTGGATGGAATGTATGLASQAREYGQKVADAATQAKDYLSERASVVGDKFQDLRNKDYAQVAEDAKAYARQNPGQALLISAAAGFVIGLLLRGGRR